MSYSKPYENSILEHGSDIETDIEERLAQIDKLIDKAIPDRKMSKKHFYKYVYCYLLIMIVVPLFYIPGIIWYLGNQTEYYFFSFIVFYFVFGIAGFSYLMFLRQYYISEKSRYE